MYTTDMTDAMTMRDARAHLADLLDKAAAGEATVLTRNGARAAAIIPIEMFDALEEAADELAAREAIAVLEAEGDGPSYTMAEIVADILGEAAA